MQIFLLILILSFIIGFIIGLREYKSISEASKSGIGCVIALLILSVLFLIVTKTCSEYNDPNSGINRQIRDGYNLYD